MNVLERPINGSPLPVARRLFFDIHQDGCWGPPPDATKRPHHVAMRVLKELASNTLDAQKKDTARRLVQPTLLAPAHAPLLEPLLEPLLGGDFGCKPRTAGAFGDAPTREPRAHGRIQRAGCPRAAQRERPKKQLCYTEPADRPLPLNPRPESPP
jgi:hypothetical protein